LGCGRGELTTPEERNSCLKLIEEAIAGGARKYKACEMLNLKIRTIERWKHQLQDKRQTPKNGPQNALSEEERIRIIEVVNGPEYAHLPPCKIVPALADKNIYLGSESTFYRICRKENLLAHRLRSNPAKQQKPDELKAIGPNQIWSWDITYLKASIKGTYYFLYLPMDIFSRKIVYWEIHKNESAELSAQMIQKACLLNNIQEHQLIIRSDNGGPMKGATMLSTLEMLGVVPSFSRPRVSDDNPFSEALFRTMKYVPSFPDSGFRSLEEAEKWVSKFVDWYNNEHLHSGINFVTPASRHRGEDEIILKNRHQVYVEAKIKNPSRWSGQTRNWSKNLVVEIGAGKNKKDDNFKKGHKIYPKGAEAGSEGLVA
jgi:transposase InsO family protein